MNDDILEFEPNNLDTLQKIDFSLVESFITDADEKARVARWFHAVTDILQASEEKKKERMVLWAERLECSVSTVYRKVKRVCEEKTLAAVVRTRRSDFGEIKGSKRWKTHHSKINEGLEEVLRYWIDFIGQTYKEGNTGARFMNRNQVFSQVKGHAEIELGLKEGEYPSVSFVYKIVEGEEAYIKHNKKRARRPYQGPKVVVETYYYNSDGDKVFETIIVERSNQVWQIDHTQLNNLFVDANYEEIGAIWLTSVIETYSGCAMGCHLSFDSPNTHAVALALRHAILPKKYGPEYKLKKKWIVCGKPEYILTDSAKEFKDAAHMQRIASELGIKLRFRVKTEDGGIIERHYREIKEELDSYLQGYRGGSVAERPKNPEKYACITYEEYERWLIRFFVDHRNQHLYPRVKNQTRLQRWEAGFIGEPDIPDERYLDLCLLKQNSRKVQAYGTIEFECLVYVTGWYFDEQGLWRYQKENNFLLHLENHKISLRYTPNNIVYILAYTQEENGQPSRFLGVLRARDIEGEHLSLKQWTVRKEIIRAQGKKIDQSSIWELQRDLHRRGNELTKEYRERSKGRKQRRREEQDRITEASKHSKVIMANFGSSQSENSQSSKTDDTSLSDQEALKLHEDAKAIPEPEVLYVISDWDEFTGNDW